MIGEFDSTGNLIKTFVYASKSHVPDYLVDNSNTKYKLLTDQLGSARFVVNSTTGEIKEKMNLDEFGKVLFDTNPNYIPFGFAGGIYDSETKLVRFGVRDYDSVTGRWMSKDPIRFNGGDLNLYGYVIQDPVNFIDPEGMTGINAGVGDYIKKMREAFKFKKNLERIQDKLLCLFNKDLCKDGRKPDQNPLPPEDPNKDPDEGTQNSCLIGGAR